MSETPTIYSIVPEERKSQTTTVFLPDKGIEVEMLTVSVPVTEDFLATIIGDKGQLYASFYDIVAREMGISFSPPEILEETENRIKILVKSQYYSRQGQIIQDAQIVSIDVGVLYEESRLKWCPTKWDRDAQRVPDEKKIEELKEKGYLLDEPIYDENDMPVRLKRKLPPLVEADLYKNFLTLRKNKLAKAITVAHRALTQRACGVKAIKVPSRGEREKDPNWISKIAIQIHTWIPKAKRVEGIQAVNDLYDDNGADDDLPFSSVPGEEEEKQGEATHESPPEIEPDTCMECGTMGVPKKVQEYSQRKYGRTVCFSCQQKMKNGG
jgi:hypothetical protein